jgi:hypothetical protein
LFWVNLVVMMQELISHLHVCWWCGLFYTWWTIYRYSTWRWWRLIHFSLYTICLISVVLLYPFHSLLIPHCDDSHSVWCCVYYIHSVYGEGCSCCWVWRDTLVTTFVFVPLFVVVRRFLLLLEILHSLRCGVVFDLLLFTLPDNGEPLCCCWYAFFILPGILGVVPRWLLMEAVWWEMSTISGSLYGVTLRWRLQCRLFILFDDTFRYSVFVDFYLLFVVISRYKITLLVRWLLECVGIEEVCLLLWRRPRYLTVFLWKSV